MTDYRDSKKKMDEYLEKVDKMGSDKIKRKQALASKDLGT